MITLDELRVSTRAVVTVTETAALLECDERTVRRACADGQIPSIRVGARLLVLRQQLVDLLDNSHAGPAATTDEPAGPLRLQPKASA